MKISFAKVSRAMYTARQKALPKSPTNAIEIEEAFRNEYVHKNYGMTRRFNADEKRDFFKHAFECDDFAYCVFASDDVIKAITENVPIENRNLFADGTFKITPIGIFKQVLILFCKINESVSFFLIELFTYFFKCNILKFANFLID